jgi:hypothetical protein
MSKTKKTTKCLALTKTKKKITSKDIQDNLVRIDGSCKWINSEIDRIIDKIKTLDRTTDEGEAEYRKLRADLDDMHEVYKTMQEQYKAQLEVLKKYKDSRFYIPPKDLITIFVISGLAFFGISLDREDPKAVKLSSFVLKLFPFKG